MGLLGTNMSEQVTKGDGSHIFMTLQLTKIFIIFKNSHYKLLIYYIHVKV
jgi:hypothetical protein